MQNSSNGNKKSHFIIYYIGVVILWLFYAWLNFISPQPTQVTGRYGLNIQQVQVIRLSVLIPFLFIWLAAIFALLHFKNYSKSLEDSKEAASFKNITKGIYFLVIAVVLPQFLSLYSAFNPDSLQAQKVITIIRTYVTIVLYLFAFWNIYQASKHLVNVDSSLQARPKPNPVPLLVFITFLSVLYCSSIFLNTYRSVSNDAAIKPTYYLSDPLIVLTIVFPYILVWILGMVATYNIYFFSRSVPGIIYRKAFRSVAWGLGSIIFLSILLQFLSQSGAYFGRAGLGAILSIVYLILIAIAIGYLFIAKGARELTVIEEI